MSTYRSLKKSTNAVTSAQLSCLLLETNAFRQAKSAFVSCSNSLLTQL